MPWGGAEAQAHDKGELNVTSKDEGATFETTKSEGEPRKIESEDNVVDPADRDTGLPLQAGSA